MHIADAGSLRLGPHEAAGGDLIRTDLDHWTIDNQSVRVH
jgi:hypothetical protein